MNFDVRDLTGTGWCLTLLSAAAIPGVITAINTWFTVPSGAGYAIQAMTIAAAVTIFAIGTLVLPRIGLPILRTSEETPIIDAAASVFHLSGTPAFLGGVLKVLFFGMITCGLIWAYLRGINRSPNRFQPDLFGVLIGVAIFATFIVQLVKLYRCVISITFTRDQEIRVRRAFSTRHYNCGEVSDLAFPPGKSGPVLQLHFAGDSRYRMAVSEREADELTAWLDSQQIDLMHTVDPHRLA